MFHQEGLMGNRYLWTSSTVSTVLILLFSSYVVRADVTGSIQGVVRDRTQGAIAGVRITVTNTQTNFKQETISAADGSYHVLALPAGIYKLNATGTGFQQFNTTDVEVKVNDQLHIDITLEVGSVQQEISVVANAVQVETESTQLGDVVDSKKMLSLPLNGRSYIDLLGLQAGVVPITSDASQHDRFVSGNGNSGQVSVNGQRETSNSFMVNGGDVEESVENGASIVPTLDSIEEFRLLTNSFNAEYGRFSGAIVNVITKSGTNEIHGSLYEFLRNEKLDARSYFDPARGVFKRNQFGGTIGNPIIKNKLFFFGDYQGTRE